MQCPCACRSGLHWHLYCTSRCLYYLCCCLRRAPSRLRYCYSRSCQSTINPAAEKAVAVIEQNEKPCGETSNFIVDQKYAIDGDPAVASNLQSTEDDGTTGKTQRRTLLEQGSYEAGIGVVDSAAAARVAVAHTLESIGSGRFRSEVTTV